jgi:hypothetical protein
MHNQLFLKRSTTTAAFFCLLFDDAPGKHARVLEEQENQDRSSNHEFNNPERFN